MGANNDHELKEARGLLAIRADHAGRLADEVRELKAERAGSLRVAKSEVFRGLAGYFEQSSGTMTWPDSTLAQMMTEEADSLDAGGRKQVTITLIKGRIETSDGQVREFQISDEGFSQWGNVTSALRETVDALHAITEILRQDSYIGDIPEDDSEAEATS